MKQYAETMMSGKSVLVEVSSNAEVAEELQKGIGTKRISFDEIIADVKRAAKEVFDTLMDLGVEEIELSYGVSLGVKAGVSFWVISEINSNANVTIKIKWKASKKDE